MSETIRLQLQHLLNADDVEYVALQQPESAVDAVAPHKPEQDRRNIHIEQLAQLTKTAISNDTTEELNDVLLELEQNQEAEIRNLCENNDSPLMSVAGQLQQVNLKARDVKSTIAIVGQQIERSSSQLIEKVSRHVHMKRTRVNIEESLSIVKLCLLALEHTNQVQELLKSNHKVAAVQNLQDLQGMELDELRNLGMGTLISQAISGLSSEITSATLSSLSDFFNSRALKTHIEEVGVRADKLTQAQRKAWESHVAEHRHLRAFRFNSPVELAYRRSMENYLTDSQLKVDLGPLCEAEMVFRKLGKEDELRAFLEMRFSRFCDDLAITDIDLLLQSVHKIVGFTLLDRVCSNVLPASRPAKLVDDTWEKLAQNISGVVGSSMARVSDYKVLERSLGMIMSTLQNFEFNVAIINDLFRTLLTRITAQIVEKARAAFNEKWSGGDHMQLVVTTKQSYDSVMSVVWYDPQKYEDSTSNGKEPELPKAMPFSEIYVVTCRYLRNLMQAGTSFLEYFQQEPGFVENAVSSAIDGLLSDPVCSKMEAVAKGDNRELVVQTSINLQLFESACGSIEQSLAKLRGATGRRGTVSLEAKPKLAKAAKLMEERIHTLVEGTVTEVFQGGFDWEATELEDTPSSTILEMTTYMLTMANTILKRLPPQTRNLTYFTLTENIGSSMCNSLYEIPPTFTDAGLSNFETDLKFLETSMSEIAIQSTPSDTLVEVRQTLELLRSPDPAAELSEPTIRNRKYGRVSQAHASQLVQKLSKRKTETSTPMSPDPGQAISPKASQSGFMRYLSGDK